jgi:hypothetical protein
MSLVSKTEKKGDLSFERDDPYYISTHNLVFEPAKQDCPEPVSSFSVAYFALTTHLVSTEQAGLSA